MKIVVIGLNHKTAPVDVRERLAFPGPKLEEGLACLQRVPEVREVALLSTCNRVEILACVGNTAVAVENIQEFLASFHRIERACFEKSLFVHTDSQAVRHVFRVASSLDSMVVGEPQILGQLKDTFDFALRKKTTGVMLNKLMKKAISTAKRVRTETKIAENAVSISFAAVELARKIFSDLTGKSFMLLGAGEMAELAARHLVTNGVRDVMVVNRTYDRGCELAREFSGRPVRFEDFLCELLHCDILICSTGAPAYVLLKDQMHKVMRERKHRPVFIIDISVPRNIDPEINRIENVYLYDVDNLQDVVENNILERKREAEKAETIITEEVEAFVKWMASLNSIPTIVALRQKAEEIKEEELEKFRNKYPDLDNGKKKAVEYLATAIINKLIHPPTAALKEDTEDRDELIATIKKLYGLNGEENEE
ncbi:MAG: glutamyl-tRNA reductase [Alphaproteobacteria bacterium]|uniref:Glutamyl-tRNA reductase n=1 Tax=Candidatus Nitrobium versatile TaxID=2884831 RepID=A0A953JC11_9BACT|nr:glutamyl-tRNA reductase [Candidatus Nitrobium versatile]